MADKEDKAWLLRGVPERIRYIVKSYSGAHGLTVAEALEFLIDTAVEAKEIRRIRWHDALLYFKHAGLPEPPHAEAAHLLGKAAVIRARLRKYGEADTSGLDLESLKFAGLMD